MRIQSKNNENFYIITGMRKIEDKLAFLESEKEELKKQKKIIAAAAIDYLQLQQSYKTFKTKKERMAFVVDEIMEAKNYLDIMVHAASQVGRGIIKRFPPIPHYYRTLWLLIEIPSVSTLTSICFLMMTTTCMWHLLLYGIVNFSVSSPGTIPGYGTGRKTPGITPW